MNLGQLEVFITIVDTGSLTEAAEVVGLTQSAVSYSLSKLEAELGVVLLERGRNGVSVTRIGQIVLQHARSILAQMESIRQETARERGLSIGKLRLGIVPTIPARLLTGMMRDFQHRYPDIEIVLFEGTPRELVEWLDNGIIDIGTVLMPDAYPLTVPLAYTEVKCIVSNRNPLAHKAEGTLPVSLLEREAMIGPKAEYGLLSQHLGLEYLMTARVHHEVSTQNTILAMVREDMGVSLIPAILLERELEGITALSLEPKIHVNVYLAARTFKTSHEIFVTTASQWAKNHGFFADENDE